MERLRTLKTLIEACGARGPRPAVIAFGDSAARWSYGEIAGHALQLASGLKRKGVSRLDPVLLWAPNSPEWIVAYFAVVCAGALAVPFNDLAGARELAHVVRDCGCQRVFTVARHVGELRALDGGDRLEIILLDAAAEAGAARERGVAPWRDLMAPQAALPELGPDDPASLLYTSGTTGVPKGVPLTHRNFLSNLEALLAHDLAGPSDRVFLPLPLHHAYAFTVGLLAAFGTGAALVLPAGLSGPQMTAALKAGHASILIGVPRLYTALIAGIMARVKARGRVAWLLFRALLAASTWLCRRTGLHAGRFVFRGLHRQIGPGLRIVASGGARLDPEAAWTLEGLGWTVLTGYGLTETAPLLTFSAPKRRRIGTEGTAAPGVELRIEAEEGAPFGEILARGPNVFTGYWKNLQATRESFTAEGWFKTGDLGALDAQGFLTIVGRAKEMIALPGGENIFPEEVEAAYAATKCIAEIAVMERDGKLFALVVPEPDAIRERGAARIDAVLREEIEAVSLTLPSYRRVSGYAVTREQLPRTHLGKLRRHLLPEMLERATRAAPAPEAPLSPEDRALLANPVAAALYSWLKARYPARPVTPDTIPQLDLGIDSLEWVGLTLEMQSRLGIALTEAALARVMTVRDLLREAVAAAAAPPERAPVTAVSAEDVWLRPAGPVFLALAIMLYWLNRAAMRRLFSLEIVGAGNVPPAGALVLAPNHASYLDPLALAAALPWRRLANAYWAGWTGKLFMTPLQRLFSRAAHVLPIDPDRAPAAGLAYGSETLRRGFALVWFPEGRRSPTGEIGPFLPGVGVLLEGAQVPAVPVRIFGSIAALPRGRTIPRLRPITVVFGSPRDPAALESAGRGEDVPSRIADGLRQAVLALTPPREKTEA